MGVTIHRLNVGNKRKLRSTRDLETKEKMLAEAEAEAKAKEVDEKLKRPKKTKVESSSV